MKRTERKFNCGLSCICEDYESFHELKQVNDNREYIWGHDAHEKHEALPGRDVSQQYSFEQIFGGSDLFDKWYHDASVEAQRELGEYLKDVAVSKTEKAVVGTSVSVARALAGHPKAFNRRMPDVRKRKVIQLDWDVSVRWGYPAEDRIRNACAFVSLAKALEAHGYSVKITAARYSVGDDDDLTITTVPLKDFHTPTNERKVLYPLGAKASLFHCFVWADQKTPGSKRKMGDGHSVFYDDRSADEITEALAKEGRIVLSHTMVDRKFEGDDGHVDFKRLVEYVLEKAKDL